MEPCRQRQKYKRPSPGMEEDGRRKEPLRGDRHPLSLLLSVICPCIFTPVSMCQEGTAQAIRAEAPTVVLCLSTTSMHNILSARVVTQSGESAYSLSIYLPCDPTPASAAPTAQPGSGHETDMPTASRPGRSFAAEILASLGEAPRATPRRQDAAGAGQSFAPEILALLA